MKYGLLFGSKSDDLESIRTKIESELGEKFQKHDSFFLGGDYYRLRRPSGEMVTIRYNRELEDDLAEEEFPEFPVLISVSRTADREAWTHRVVEQLSIGEFLKQRVE